MLVFPLCLSAEHLPFTPVQSVTDYRNLYALALYLVLGALLWSSVVLLRGKQSQRTSLLGMVFLVVPYLPASHVSRVQSWVNDTFHDTVMWCRRRLFSLLRSWLRSAHFSFRHWASASWSRTLLTPCWHHHLHAQVAMARTGMQVCFFPASGAWLRKVTGTCVVTGELGAVSGVGGLLLQPFWPPQSLCTCHCVGGSSVCWPHVCCELRPGAVPESIRPTKPGRTGKRSARTFSATTQ